MSEKQGPVFTARVGLVKAAVWENTTEGGRTTHAVSLTRSYKDDNEQWHETNTYYADDLPKVQLAMGKAYDYIHCGRSPEKQQESFTEKVAADSSRRRGAGK